MANERGDWGPVRVVVRPEDVPIDRTKDAAPQGGVSQRLLGRVTHLQHVVATLVSRRLLAEQGVVLIARMHPSGVLHLLHRHGAECSRGFVVATASSMEPRPIWPMLLPHGVLELEPIDWVIGCSVPKMPALEAVTERTSHAYVLGWLASEQMDRLPIVTVQSHHGHEFEAQYRQAKNHWLRPIGEFPPLVDATGGDPQR